MALTPGFDLFQLPEEHQELRAVIRDLAEKEIAPHAADVDENERFPQEALDALKPLMKELFVTANPIMAKEALDILGFSVGGLRLPLVKATAEQRAEMEEVLRLVGDIR